MRSKIEEHAGIQIPIYYYEDDDGKKVYDYGLMTKEFETKLSELGYSSRGEVKHFADGFHEGRWEDDMERPWPVLDEILENVVEDDWESVKSYTMSEYEKKYSTKNIKEEE